MGFDVINQLSKEFNISVEKSKFKGLYGSGTIQSEKVILLKPQTYMNLSGNSVVKAAMFYKILPDNIVVIHDDMDLDISQIKAKTGGGSGGHNGLKSIDSHITNGYHRVRLGVGHPKGVGEVVVNHVLSRFSKTEQEFLDKNIELVTENIGILLKEGMSAFSNKIGMLRHK
jgi:PTH1 family peptidyl-tRNA hydrolase